MTWYAIQDLQAHTHAHFSRLQSLIRMLMGMGGYIPVSSDALVTPVTFSVRRRRLPGILADLDAAEDGNRELSGEWVVGKRTWRRLQREWRAQRAQVKSSAEPTSAVHAHRRNERVVLYLQGGAYYAASSEPSD